MKTTEKIGLYQLFLVLLTSQNHLGVMPIYAKLIYFLGISLVCISGMVFLFYDDDKK